MSRVCCPPALRPSSHQSAFSTPPSGVNVKSGSCSSWRLEDPSFLRCCWTWEGRWRWKKSRKLWNSPEPKELNGRIWQLQSFNLHLNMCWPVHHLFLSHVVRVDFRCLCGLLGRWNHLSATCSDSWALLNMQLLADWNDGKGEQLFFVNYTVNYLSIAAHQGLYLHTFLQMLVLVFKKSSSRFKNPPLTCSKNSFLAPSTVSNQRLPFFLPLNLFFFFFWLLLVSVQVTEKIS